MRVTRVKRVFGISKPFFDIYEACAKRVTKRVTHISPLQFIKYERNFTLWKRT